MVGIVTFCVWGPSPLNSKNRLRFANSHDQHFAHFIDFYFHLITNKYNCPALCNKTTRSPPHKLLKKGALRSRSLHLIAIVSHR